MTDSIVDMDDIESRDTLEFLFDHCEQDKFVYKHQWTVGLDYLGQSLLDACGLTFPAASVDCCSERPSKTHKHQPKESNK